MRPDRTDPRILVAGLGNELLGDDGAGVYVVRELEAAGAFAGRPNVAVVDFGTAVLGALHWLEWADRILAVDAMKAGSAPGTVYRWDPADWHAETPPMGLHEVGILEGLGMVGRPHPPQLAVLGVEPEFIGYRMALSDAVRATVPILSAYAEQTVNGWCEMAAACAGAPAAHTRNPGRPASCAITALPRPERILT